MAMRDNFKSGIMPLMVLTLLLCAVSLVAQKGERGNYDLSVTDGQESDAYPADRLRHIGLHNAGNIYMPIGSGLFPSRYIASGSAYDPETGDRIGPVSFPLPSSTQYLYSGGISFGGVVNGDSLVSQGVFFTNSFYSSEIFPEYPDSGGVIRTASFADDEFRAIYYDTITDLSITGNVGPYDTVHTPLGLKITQTSYAWWDSLYDDFVIIEYLVENIGNNVITDGFVGLYFDCDIYDINGDYANGYSDDASGFLDTLLIANDPGSRAQIAYSYDIDGDPTPDTSWNSESIKGVYSVSLIDSDLPDPIVNFNWWRADFGPRQLGSEEFPFYWFVDSSLGRPQMNKDAYYMLAHPEIDYNSIEMDIHDSTDGWLPSEESYNEFYKDTRFQYSFGPFNLQPGDSFNFAIAIAGTDNFHVNPDDYVEYFQADSPLVFQEHLDFSHMIDAHRRADLVYQSGMILPSPGAPVGLEILEYDDSFVIATWNPSQHPRLVGYHLNIKDTVYDDLWRHAFPNILTDTICTLSVMNPGHEYFLAVSLEDDQGRESALSFPISVFPGRPHAPEDLTIDFDEGIVNLNWRPFSDTSLVVYLIYRGIWEEPLELYDSTVSLSYDDHLSSSGIRYSYAISARNLLDLESELTPVVTATPMIMDRGILYYDLNHDFTVSTGPYEKRYSTRMKSMIEPYYPVESLDIEQTDISFMELANYSLVIFDTQKESEFLSPYIIDSIRYYLESGGAGLFLLSNVVTSSPSPSRSVISYYTPGDFFYDILLLDSSSTNWLGFFNGSAHGDLIGCLPEKSGYPELVTDSSKMDMSGPVNLIGYIPRVGHLYPRDEADILYRYNALNPDSGFHNQVNGIEYISDSLNICVLNFPLSLMTEPANIDLLKKVLTNLGADFSCGDIDSNGGMNVGDIFYLIRFLFDNGPPPPVLYRADVNCDGATGLEDAIMLINLIFKDGAGLNCCPQ